jgi:hypothetical protein
MTIRPAMQISGALAEEVRPGYARHSSARITNIHFLLHSLSFKPKAVKLGLSYFERLDRTEC